MKKLAMVCILAITVSIPIKANAKDTYLSEDIQRYCEEIGEQYYICPELLEAIVEKESSGKSDAKNGQCKGLMQIHDKFHKERMERLGVTDIHDEYGNILVGADYLAELFEEYEDVGYVLDIYSGNSKADENYEKGVLSSYAKSILTRSESLERQHGK